MPAVPAGTMKISEIRAMRSLAVCTWREEEEAGIASGRDPHLAAQVDRDVHRARPILEKEI
jgi:hypothetical protein